MGRARTGTKIRPRRRIRAVVDHDEFGDPRRECLAGDGRDGFGQEVVAAEGADDDGDRRPIRRHRGIAPRVWTGGREGAYCASGLA